MNLDLPIIDFIRVSQIPCVYGILSTASAAIWMASVGDRYCLYNLNSTGKVFLLKINQITLFFYTVCKRTFSFVVFWLLYGLVGLEYSVTRKKTKQTLLKF